MRKCRYCKNIIDNDNIYVLAELNKNNKYFHKKENCYSKYLFELKHKCTYCKKKILFEDEYNIVEDNIMLHSNCLGNYTKKIKETKEWNNLYKFVRTDILGYKSNMSLSKHQIFSLKNLREGKIIKKGDIQKYNGYSFKEIHLAFEYKKNDILKYIQNKKFQNENKKFDYIIAIIRNSINDILIAKEEKKKNEDQMKKIIISDEQINYNKKSAYNKSLFDLVEE